jgi:hypothetical protein
MKWFMCKVLHRQLSLFWIVLFSYLHCVSICKMGMLSWLWGSVCVWFFQNMFVNLFDFQNQFLFVFFGYVYVSGSYFLLFVFFKVFLCLGGLLSFVCLFFEGMSMSLGSAFFLLFVYFFSLCMCLSVSLNICVCLWRSMSVCVCLWRSMGVYVFKVCVSLFVSLNEWVKLELKVQCQ